MNTPISFFVPGTPVGKERPRKGRYGNFYTPKRTHRYEDLVRLCFRQLYARLNSPRGKWWLEVRIYGPCRADGDNILKSILDSLSEWVWHDDRQVRHGEFIFMDGQSFNGKSGVLITVQEI